MLKKSVPKKKNTHVHAGMQTCMKTSAEKPCTNKMKNNKDGKSASRETSKTRGGRLPYLHGTLFVITQ